MRERGDAIEIVGAKRCRRGVTAKETVKRVVEERGQVLRARGPLVRATGFTGPSEGIHWFEQGVSLCGASPFSSVSCEAQESGGGISDGSRGHLWLLAPLALIAGTPRPRRAQGKLRSLAPIAATTGPSGSGRWHPWFRSGSPPTLIARTPRSADVHPCSARQHPCLRSLAPATQRARRGISDRCTRDSDRWRACSDGGTARLDLRVFENGFMTPLRPCCDDACGGE